MCKIQVLDNKLINQIAAGEVVERPSSVIKELVENSIDANSSIITVEIKEGGISLIRITDNGRGIEKEQVKTAFLRHATSKIENITDLVNVLTLGFRGEALSSISSVSQMEIVTKTRNSLVGYRAVINGGVVEDEQEIGCADGTSIIMRNLFFNTPARRKFLKKPATESGYISDFMNKIALGHPEISFKYINNQSIMLQTNGNGDLKTTILQVYGKDVASKVLNVTLTKPEISLDGFIGKPELARSNRTYENFFINGRYIKNEIIQSAVEEAFKTRLPIGKFPLFVLNMKITPSLVDVNVHPTKLEVRFSDEEKIYNYVLEATSNAFKNQNLIPKSKWNSTKYSEAVKSEPFIAEEIQNTLSNYASDYSGMVSVNEESLPYIVSEPEIPKANKVYYKEYKQESEDINIIDEIMPDKNIHILNGIIHDKKSVIENLENIESKKSVEANNNFFHSYKIIGQIFNTYWIVEQNNCMYLIDQHAAHEKVLYEELFQKLKDEEIVSQILLSPIAVNLSDREMQIAKDNLVLLQSFGYELEEFGQNTIAIRGVPYIFKEPSKSDFFIEIIDKLSKVDTSIHNIYDTKIMTIATISCKAAVKGNDKLNYMEAKSLIEKIMNLKDPFTCPHGRPTIIEMSKYELEKKFKRIQ